MEYKEKPFVSPVGGQALLEGVLMKSPQSLAMAVRDDNGELVVFSERNKKGRKWYHKAPIIRGVVAFANSLTSGIRYIAKGIEPLGEEEEQLGKGEMAISVLVGIVLAVGLFAVLPKLVNWLFFDLWLNLSETLKDRNDLYVLITVGTSGIIRVGILVLYMASISAMKSIKRMYQYHGAEHRTINCYEHRLELTVENVQSCSTRHNRCGTTFLFYTVMMSIIISIIVAFFLASFGLDINSVKTAIGNDALGTLLYNVILIGSNIVMFPVTAGLSYEFLRLMAKAPDNWFFMIFKAPGLALQKLSTKTPDDEMAEAAILAFKTVMELDADKDKPEFDFYEMTVADAIKMTKKKYEKAGGIEECEVDWTLCQVLDCNRNEIHNAKTLNKEQGKKLRKIIAKRINGVPLDYITGHSEFFGFEIKVTENVLIPRMDTETVVGYALEMAENRKTVLDLMTGSGCIAAVISGKTDCKVTASDISEKALEVAKSNLPESVNLICSDVFESINEKFDMIISNPPYIKSGDICQLQKEVQMQPSGALDGGGDGLKFYRIIAKEAPEYLTENGALVLEIGCDQADDVKKLLKENFKDIKIYRDLGGNDRTITALKK